MAAHEAVLDPLKTSNFETLISGTRGDHISSVSASFVATSRDLSGKACGVRTSAASVVSTRSRQSDRLIVE